MRRLKLRLLCNWGPREKFDEVMYRLLVCASGRNELPLWQRLNGTCVLHKGWGKDAKLITKYLNTVLDSDLCYIWFQERNTLRHISKKCESEIIIENNRIYIKTWILLVHKNCEEKSLKEMMYIMFKRKYL